MKGNADCLLIQEGPITTDFKSQGTTINSEDYQELLSVVKEYVRSKRRGLQTKTKMFRQDNARLHTAACTIAKNQAVD